MKTNKKRTRKNKTNKNKNNYRGGGWFWNDNSTNVTSNVQTEPSSNEEKKTWGSWLSGLFSSKKSSDVNSSAPVVSGPVAPGTVDSGPVSDQVQKIENNNKGGKRKSKKMYIK